MSFFERSLVGKQIHSVHVDSEVTCLMLTDGTQLTIRGWEITAEQLVTRIAKGYRRTEWQKTRDRNDALDCRNYARAAAAV